MFRFDLDSHDTYRAADEDPSRMVPNPAKKSAYRDVEKARRALHLAKTASDTALLVAIPDHDTLHIRLDPLPAPRHTAAIDELCHALNDTNTVYPGTGLTLRYSIKSHRRPHTHS